MDDSADALIAQKVLDGDKEAFAHIVNRYKGPLINLVFRMTANRDVAVDLAQETFVKAYAGLSRYDPEKSFFTWLYTICLNLTRNHLAKKRETLLDTTDQAVQHDLEESRRRDNPESLAIQRQEFHGLEKALNTLPVDLREAVVLRYMQDLPFDAIARMLNIGLSAAKMRVSRGLERLRAAMTHEDASDGI